MSLRSAIATSRRRTNTPCACARPLRPRGGRRADLAGVALVTDIGRTRSSTPTRTSSIGFSSTCCATPASHRRRGRAQGGGRHHRQPSPGRRCEHRASGRRRPGLLSAPRANLFQPFAGSTRRGGAGWVWPSPGTGPRPWRRTDPRGNGPAGTVFEFRLPDSSKYPAPRPLGEVRPALEMTVPNQDAMQARSFGSVTTGRVTPRWARPPSPQGEPWSARR